MGGYALAFANKAQEEVLGADVIVAQLEGFTKRQLHYLLGARGKGRGTRRRSPGWPDRLFYLHPHRLKVDTERSQRLGRHVVALTDKAKKEVLGTDEVVVQQARFLLGQHQHPASIISEAFEHLFSQDRAQQLIRVPFCLGFRSAGPAADQGGNEPGYSPA